MCIRDSFGVALLTFTEDPNFFVTDLRAYLQLPPFAALQPKPEYTMLGRTYAPVSYTHLTLPTSDLV